MQDSHEPTDRPDDGPDAVDETTTDEVTEATKELLEEHVPLSLIMDLTAPDGPHSKEILDAEGAPEQAWWEQP
ncbi:MAG: hypothetical protein ACTHN8_18775 [Angustibacter sp.]